ncbi:hypothetical protein ACQPYH_28600 [Kribbella sp. CA-245084]|uniref:hypothetical protein n=1 Tax=Kribbella sp. CA-245084 TaxID=3239940 RepID=UPI003D8B0908
MSVVDRYERRVLCCLQGEFSRMANVSTLRRTAIVADEFDLATEVTSISALLLIPRCEDTHR